VQIVRTVFWKKLDTPGSEYTSLWKLESGWKIQGILLLAHENMPYHILYGIRCNPKWETREVSLRVLQGIVQRKIHLFVQNQQWKHDEMALPHLEGCIAPWFQFSPIGYFLSIQRLCLSLGESAEIHTASFSFPNLELKKAMQKYTCLDKTCYRFQCGSSSINITCDEDGLPILCPGFWELAGEFPKRKGGF
jgi:hypothetical protein